MANKKQKMIERAIGIFTMGVRGHGLVSRIGFYLERVPFCVCVYIYT